MMTTENIKVAEVFGAPGCRYCDAAKQLLKTNGFDVAYIDLTEAGQKQKLESRLSARVTSVPQIILNGEYIGGFNELQAKLKVK